MDKVWWPKKSHHGYYDEGLHKHFSSPEEKREFLKKGNLIETSFNSDPKKRAERLIEEINADRNRRGEKSLSREQAVGDGPSARHIRKTFYMGG